MKLRVWHNCQVGAVRNFYIDVDSVEHAKELLKILWEYDIFQYENHIKPDYCCASGLEYFDEKEKEWIEWEDDDGYSIEELMREA